MDIKSKYESPEGDCTGLTGYEKEDEGDGLKTSIFKTVNFTGTPVKRMEKNINNFWMGESPAIGVDANNFSIIWEGFIRAPKSGDYKFTCDNDDGCIVEIGGSVVIQDNMPLGEITDLLGYNRELFAKAMGNGEFDSIIRPASLNGPGRYKRVNKSENVPMVAGDYVPIRVKYLHSVFNSLFEDGNAWCKLYWESDMINKEIIPGVYFYSYIKEPSFKPSNYDANILNIDQLIENDAAFKDVPNYRLKFVPNAFKGMISMKFNYETSAKQIVLSFNTPTRLYLGVTPFSTNILDSTWNNSGYEMTLMKVETKDLPMMEKGETVTSSEDIDIVI